MHPNNLRKSVPLGNFDRVLVQVVNVAYFDAFISCTTPGDCLRIALDLDGDVRCTQGIQAGACCDVAAWLEATHEIPIFRGSYLTLKVLCGDDTLAEAGGQVNRILNQLDRRHSDTHTFKLYPSEAHTEIPYDVQSAVTLKISRLPPYDAIPATPRCLTGPFHATAEQISHVLQALRDAPESLGKAMFLDEKTVVKQGSYREASAMHYVARHTSIPVPRVHLYFEHEGNSFIVMDRIRGRPLLDLLPGMPSERMALLGAQLSDFVGQLAALQPRKSMGSWPGGPLAGPFFDPPPLHEFRSLDEFNAYWIWRLGPWLTEPVPESLCSPPSASLAPCRIVFSHGDLNVTNIMVEDDKITGILDWETCGWYPDFWEGMAARRGCASHTWLKALSSSLGPESVISRDYCAVLYDVFDREWAD